MKNIIKNRYLVFAGICYYPLGGWDDFKGSFKTKKEALLEAKKDWDEGWTWAHIVDSNDDTMEEVE